MTNSAKEITAAAGASAADSEDRHLEPRRLETAHPGTEPPAPQPDRLAEKFEAALAAALRGDAFKPAHSMQPATSVGDSCDPGQPDKQLSCDGTVTDCADAKDRSALLDGEGADRPHPVAQVSSPIATCAALCPPRLVLASRTSAEPDGNLRPVTKHVAPLAGDGEEDCVEWVPEWRRPEYGALHVEIAPHGDRAILRQEEGGRAAQNRSSEQAKLGDPVDAHEETASQLGLLALWPRRWDNNLIRRGLLPVAILAGLAGFGAVLLLPVLATGSPPTEIVAEDGVTTDPSAIVATDHDSQRWELSEDSIDRDAAVHVPQEPITPKQVKTVRITGRSDQPTNFQPCAELPPLEAADGISSEREGTSVIVRTDAELSSSRQTGIDASGREWSESAVQSASPAERVEFGERASAAGDEAFEESEPQVAEPDRWPISIPFEDNGQSTDRTSAASEADQLELPNGEPTLRAAAVDTGDETAAAEGDDLAVSDPVEQSPSAEPTRFASVTADVNMRAGPGNDAPVVTVIPSGRRVGVIACTAWCEVTIEGERGWVHRNFVAGEARSGTSRPDLADVRIAAGMPLISSDGAQIGTIRGQSIDSTGQQFVVVDLTDELGAAVRSIRLKSEYIAAKDEQAWINVTRARFVSSLPSKSGAEASAVTGAN